MVRKSNNADLGNQPNCTYFSSAFFVVEGRYVTPPIVFRTGPKQPDYIFKKNRFIRAASFSDNKKRFPLATERLTL